MQRILYTESQIDDLASRIKSRLDHDPADESYLIGDGCQTTRTGTGVPTRDHCYRTGQRLCDMQRIGGALLTIGANAAFGPLLVVPTNTPYFEPVAAECIVTETANPNANRRVRFTAFAIGQSPQEPIDTRAPVLATTAFMWSDHFLPGDYGPRPVQWGVFSVAALTKDLQIFGFNPNAVAVDVEWLVYGNALSDLPPGAKPGFVLTSGQNPYLHSGA